MTRKNRKQGVVFHVVYFVNNRLQGIMTNLQTMGDICIFFAKNLTKMPKQYAESAFELLFPVAEMAKLSKEEQKMVDEAQKAKWDNYAIRQYAIETGLQKGMEQGMLKAAREIAKKMKARNRPISEIVEDTGLSEEEIKAL